MLPERCVVPLETVGIEGAHDEVVRAWLFARGVEILDSQQPAPARRPGIEKTGEAGDQ